MAGRSSVSKPPMRQPLPPAPPRPTDKASADKRVGGYFSK